MLKVFSMPECVVCRASGQSFHKFPHSCLQALLGTEVGNLIPPTVIDNATYDAARKRCTSESDINLLEDCYRKMMIPSSSASSSLPQNGGAPTYVLNRDHRYYRISPGFTVIVNGSQFIVFSRLLNSHYRYSISPNDLSPRLSPGFAHNNSRDDKLQWVRTCNELRKMFQDLPMANLSHTNDNDHRILSTRLEAEINYAIGTKRH